MKYFYSKGAFLVLIWMCLLGITSWSYFKMYDTLFQGIEDVGNYSQFGLVPIIPLLFLAPFAGWLADARFGNFKVFRAGCYLLFIASLMACISVLILESSELKQSTMLLHFISGGVAPIVYGIWIIGLIACFVTALELGLDQMPEASTSNTTSFIAWFQISLSTGLWISDSLHTILLECTTNSWMVQLMSSLPIICTSISCCTMFLLAKKWLVIEPNTTKALKTIYQVLKFAAKHKAPIYRSALTYWEENVPSRLDLGKTKYGGPFTTEQVEDVKTFFKILIVLTPLVAVFSATTSIQTVWYWDHTNSSCSSVLIYGFGYSPWWTGIVTMIAYEIIIYPFVKNRLPSTLKRIGFGSFCVLLSNTAYFIIIAIEEFHYGVNITSGRSWLYMIYCAFFGVLSNFTILVMFQFVCAQSPYRVRGLLAGYAICLFTVSISLGIIVLFLFNYICESQYCSLIQALFSIILALIGFIMYCLLARWYKWRVRDEDYNAHRVVEEVYNRYLASPTIN
ncbi:solute carrier family 15 member 4-like [Halichondria panicea]|uniref:solute carrier family 15 member 4-like n=1 Tax=Halichondria panicea TaxID=6063 RepID=UPI00312B772D